MDAQIFKYPDRLWSRISTCPKVKCQGPLIVGRIGLEGQAVAPALLTDAAKDTELAWPDVSCPVLLEPLKF